MKIRMNHHENRRGFTLVELIVVLTILVGLAAVLIPAVTDMIKRTSTSSSASNITEVANAIQRYEAQFLSYPNNMDSLVSDLAAGTDLNTLDSGLTALAADVTLTTALRAPLTSAGITTLGVHTAGDDTFVKPTQAALADDDIIKGLTAAAQVSLGLETAGVANKYVLLGVGPSSEMNGKTMIDAPVYFPEVSADSPGTIYGRYIAVFQILQDATTALERARFVTVLTPVGTNLDNRLGEYFETTVED